MTEEEKLTYIGKLQLFGRDAKLYIIIAFLGAFSWGISGVIFNLYLRDAGFPEDFIGFFLSVSMFATALIAFAAGLFTDRSSRKRIILVANLIGFLVLVVQYTTLNPMGLIFSQIFLGLSSAFREVAWAPYVTDISSDRERAHLFGVGSGVSLLGVFMGNIIGGSMPQIFAGILGIAPTDPLVVPYRFTLWLSLIPSLIAILLISRMTVDTPSFVSTGFALRHVKNWRFIGKYTSSIASIGLGAGMIVMFFNLFFTHEFPIDSQLLGIIFGVNTIILSAGNFLAPALADRIGKVRTVVLTEALSIPFLLTLSYADTLQLAVLGYVARNVLMNMSGPVSNAFFMEGLTKEERATAVGVVRTADSFVRAIAANIGGWLLAIGLYRLPYVLVSGLYVLGITVFFGFFRNKEEELKLLSKVELSIEEPPESSVDAT
ncbi:MAG: MFS transporter [Candidatus Thorarchaeota archaeon]